MQFAMSRNREYLADASGVQLTRYPPGLISALEKLRDDHAVVHHATKATAQMWIEQPLEAAADDGKKHRVRGFNNAVRHPPAARRPDQAPPGDVGDDAGAKIVVGIVVAVLVIGAAALGGRGGDGRRRHREARGHDEGDGGHDRGAHDRRARHCAAVPIAPLTGLPDPGGASQTRPALSVKVENTPDARPQAGIDQADVVYEEEVEGSITRFLAMFNSAIPETSGRSARCGCRTPTSCGRSAGSSPTPAAPPTTVAAINAAPVHAVDEQRRGRQRRQWDGARPRPVSRRASRPTTSTATVRRSSRSAAIRSRRRRCSRTPSPESRHRPTPTRRARVSVRIGFLADTTPPTRGTRRSGTWKRSHGGTAVTSWWAATRSRRRTWSCQFTQYEGEGRTARPSARVTCGCSPTAGCARALDPARQGAARAATSMPTALPILLHPGKHVGRAAAGGHMPSTWSSRRHPRRRHHHP